MEYKKEPKKIIYGFAILRSILAFYVVKTHCFRNNSTKNKFMLYILGKRHIHVPSFFIISFYFTYKGLISKDSIKISKRFERLLIPYIFWPIIIFFINNIFGEYFKVNIKYPFKKLIIQLVLGRGIINPLWFQLDLMLTTFLFLVIIYIFDNYYLFLLQLLKIVAYFLQYSNYNYYIFEHTINEFRFSIGREIMMIPFAVSGFSLAHFKIIEYLQKNKYITFIFSILTFILIDNFDVFCEFTPYNGIKFNVLSLCLIFVFSLLSFENINKYIKIFIHYITRYTAGVFYLHIYVAYYSRNFILSVKNGTIEGLFIIYIICYSICHFGILLFGKSKAKNLFS